MLEPAAGLKKNKRGGTPPSHSRVANRTGRLAFGGILESKSRIHVRRRKFGCAGACWRRAAQAGDIIVTDGSEAAWYTGPDKEGAQMHRILLAEDDDAIVRLLTDFCGRRASP